MALVRQHVNALMEHFEAVQILVSITDAEGTHNVHLGGGNWFARQGMAHQFIRHDQAQTNAHAIAKAMPRPESPDEGEEWKQS
jgi:hypothetical protein